jgi:hypothetical protein
MKVSEMNDKFRAIRLNFNDTMQAVIKHPGVSRIPSRLYIPTLRAVIFVEKYFLSSLFAVSDCKCS